jgi:glycosyltransferase involved in cell wall biosynthesis
MHNSISTPLVSVVIPCFNYGHYLSEALDSLISQTYLNWECIVVDDGSIDNTKEVAAFYCSKDARITYIYQNNSGVSVARNSGIKHSKGEYILPLDADDIIAPEYLSKAVSILNIRADIKLVYCDAELFGDKNGPWHLPDFSFENLLKGNMIFCSALFRKSDFVQTNGYNSAMRYRWEDWDFWISFLKDGGKVHKIPEVLFFYRIKENSRERNINVDTKRITETYAALYKNHYDLYKKYNLLVSVSVILFNNNIQELPRLIKSVLNQSLPFFELLLVNKYHENESKKIADWYAQQDERIKILTFSHEQTWEVVINKAVVQAKGQWLWIVTPETYPDERFLETLLPHAEGNAGAGLVMSACRLYHYNALVGKFPADDVNEGTGKWLNNTIMNSEDAIKSTFVHYNPIISISTLLIKRDLYNQAGGVKSYSSTYWDWLLYIKILLHAKLIYIATEVSFVVYSQRFIDKKLGKATEIMSLSEYTHFISALLTIFKSNNYITSLLLKLYSKVWCDNASQGLIKLGHLKLMSQMLQPLDTKVKGSLYKNLLLINSNFSSVSQSILKQLLEKNNSGLALKYNSKQSLANAAKPYLVKLPEVAKERPRILHVIANFITGGSSRLVIDLIEYLGSEYEQEVVVPYLSYPPAYIGQVIRPLGGYQAEEINKYIAGFNPHIMHVHYWGKGDYKWYELFFRAAEKQQIPVVENINVPVQPYYSTSVKKYVYVSKFVQDEYALPGTKGVVIYPGSNFSLFNSDIHTSNNSCIGMVYRLDEDKLNENSIDVFIKVAQRKKDSHCLIVGGGHFYELYKNKVQRAGVESNFEFTGYVAYETLPDYFKRMSLFVAPVWDESFGQVSPFAMNMGLPVVGYNVGALSEIIDNPGLLITPGDSDSLADLIVELLLNDSMRYKIANLNKKRAQELFSVQAMIQGYKELYGYTLKQDAKLKAT